jgi:hypothetical protein
MVSTGDLFLRLDTHAPNGVLVATRDPDELTNSPARNSR